MKEKIYKTFDRHSNVSDLLDKVDNNNINIESAINSKYKFTVQINGKFVARNHKGPSRFIIVDSPYIYFRESEAYDGARSFGGAKVIKEEA
jgi:hypothetical protein